MASLTGSDPASIALLDQIQSTLYTIQQDYKNLTTTVESISGKVNVLAGVQQIQEAAGDQHNDNDELHPVTVSNANNDSDVIPSLSTTPPGQAVPPRASRTSRIILTTHPGQSGIDPIPMQWGHKDPSSRGPVVVARSQSTFRRRNGRLVNSHHSCQTC